MKTLSYAFKYLLKLRGNNVIKLISITMGLFLGWVLRRITLDDAVLADATFNILMGEKVEPRKEFIARTAKYAVNLDY